MKLVADSGSTKTDWFLLDGQEQVRHLHSQGYNPYFWEPVDLAAALQKDVASHLPEGTKEIYFYGAGCSTPAKKQMVRDALKDNFPEAGIIEVDHDLLGAARALLGDSPGLAGILGTGSNSCYYDGKEVVENVPSVGYILGDEGSGNHIGRQLVTDFIQDQMPAHIKDHFIATYGLSKEEILDAIYKKPLPNKFLASFSKFAFENIRDPYVEKIVKYCFSQFFERQVTRYRRHKEVPLGIVGSVGYYFRDYLEDVAKKYGVTIGKVLETPISGLVEYHCGKKEVNPH